MQRQVIQGDCLEVMRAMEPNSVDAIVCDPPYGLTSAGRTEEVGWPSWTENTKGARAKSKGGFMGKEWDRGVPGPPFWEAALRVAKPGAYLVAAGGTRTFHRLACAIEDAGWEIRDCLSWLYGSGFPKGKACLKPAWEPFLLARKPAKRGTHLQIDASRIAGDVPRTVQGASSRIYGGGAGLCPEGLQESTPHAGGRWPANVILDPEAAALLDAQSGERKATKPGSFQREMTSRGYEGGGLGQRRADDHAPIALEKPGYGDTGGASRFYYVAKASRREREAGLEGMPTEARNGEDYRRKINTSKQSDDGVRGDVPRTNVHPCVKPLALMDWLVKLVCPPGGHVLDPFCGSGSTGCSAARLGFRFTGIEQSEEYCAIARRRICHWTPAQPDLEPAA